MTKPEIMNCAAILAAGIIANGNHGLIYNADTAVYLMNEIAAKIENQQAGEQNGNVEYF